jgi:hypothetical protein
MPWIFWMFIPFFFIMIFRRGSWHSRGDMHRRMKRKLQKHVRAGARDLETGDLDYRQDEELVEHRHYIDELEKRVAELENRLDFTERLLAGRQEVTTGGRPS